MCRPLLLSQRVYSKFNVLVSILDTATVVVDTALSRCVRFSLVDRDKMRTLRIGGGEFRVSVSSSKIAAGEIRYALGNMLLDGKKTTAGINGIVEIVHPRIKV